MSELIKEAIKEINHSYATIVDGELVYQRSAMLNMFRKGAEWQSGQSLWISVKDRLPNPLEEVILYDNKSIQHYAVGWLRKDKGYNKSMWCVTNGFVEDKYITHWSPIPALPKGGEE